MGFIKKFINKMTGKSNTQEDNNIKSLPKDLENMFNNASVKDQYRFVAEYIDEGRLIVNENETIFQVFDDKDEYHFVLKEHVKTEKGLKYLLDSVGIEIIFNNL